MSSTEIAQLQRAEPFEGDEHVRAVRDELIAAAGRYAKRKGSRTWQVSTEAVFGSRDVHYAIERYPVGYFVVVTFDGNVPERRTEVHDHLIDALRHMLSWVESDLAAETPGRLR